MPIALTRAVNPNLAQCELEFLERQPIDVPRAAQQHRNYEACLETLGVRVISLPAEPALPDSVFVEDPAIVLDEIAILCRTGAESRRKEAETIAAALAPFRELKCIREPATIEGGDVMRIGKTLYVGISRRTNREGVRQLAELIAPFGYRVTPIQVLGSLHLKSACCPLDDRTILANREWIEPRALDNFDIIDVAHEEPWAANVLRIGDAVMMPASFPVTRDLLERAGFRVVTVDISELQKAEAGVTCSSLIFSVIP
ncbi:MAG TPA: arginine deiminase family protein [Bryobacteraceae bacterium]|nr:arginine deiminase family protein [Bryobacteraceae bacterium]